jgi:sec-independent protein translocase protein TatA
MNCLAWGLGPQELLVVGVVAVLIFGRRLPEVGRALGQGLMEFKRSLKGVKGEVDETNREVRQIGDSTRRAGEDSDLDRG